MSAFELPTNDIAIVNTTEEEEEEETYVCTFAIGGKGLLHQAIYICRTCQGDENKSSSSCCCVGCADICHANHDVEYVAFGRSYCDCGESW